VSEPLVFENLAVYMIEGRDRMPGRSFLTLDEALERGMLVVHETGSVNELAAENLSDKDEVYIQAGDIVRGGRQDRVLARDLVLGPRSGRVPIPSFCVEQGRWSGREGEVAQAFASSKNCLATRELKLAVEVANDQSAVWENVARAQEKLGKATDTVVNDPRSRTSLELSLENDKVRAAADTYRARLEGALAGKSAAIGYVFAIGGVVNSAEVYGSAALFRKLWPKLLRASAVEAVANRDRATEKVPPSAKDILAFLAAAEHGNPSAAVAESRPAPQPRAARRNAQQLRRGRVELETEQRQLLNEEIQQVYVGSAPVAAVETALPEGMLERAQRESEKCLMLENRDKTGGWLHRSYFAK
jgi:hypothetical protein